MINFACRKIELSELIRCSLDMSKAEYKIFVYMLGNKNTFTVKELSKKLGLDRTSIQKSLKGLMERRILERRQKNLSKGGYVYVYRIKDKEEIKYKVLETMRRWFKQAEESIKKW